MQNLLIKKRLECMLLKIEAAIKETEDLRTCNIIIIIQK